MKQFIFVIALLLLTDVSFSQGHCEMEINNNTGGILFVKIYPVSMVFNWPDENQIRKAGYNIIARVKKNIYPSRYDYINGVYYDLSQDSVKTTHRISPSSKLCGQFDADRGGSLSGTDFCYGSGKYRFDFWLVDTLEGNESRPPDDYCTVEIDGNHFGDWNDLAIYFYAIGNIQFDLSGGCGIHPIPENHQIEIWHPCEALLRDKFYNTVDGIPFKYDIGVLSGMFPVTNPYTVLPIDPRVYCTSDYLPSAPQQNHYFQQNDIGVLTLNLTIEKNDANGNPVEITTPYQIAPFPVPGGAPPSIVITGSEPGSIVGPILKVEKGTNGQPRKLTFKKYNNLNAGTALYIQPYGRLYLAASNSASERSQISFDSCCKLESDQFGQILLGDNSYFEMKNSAYMKLSPHTKIFQYSESLIEMFNNSLVHDCGADHLISQRIYEHDQSEWKYIPSEECSFDYNPENEDLFVKILDSNSSITLYDNSSITIGSNCKIIFDGAGSFLKADPGTSIKFGEGASIEFRNGAYLEAEGCTFTSMNPTDIWNGVILDGAGPETSIQNCIFENASTSINVTGTICNIYHNTINVPVSVSGATGIEATNETNITIRENTIELGSNTTARGIYFFNYDGDGLPGGGGSSSYSLNLINNFINGGAYPVTIDCLTSSQLPFLIKANQITPASGILSYGIFAYNITGDIKFNNFVNISSSNALTLQQCNVNMYENFLQSGNTSINLQSFTTAQMSPIQNEFGQWVWYGGLNGVTSDLAYCMDFGYGSNPILSPRGTNCFTTNTQPNYHINGEYCNGFSFTVCDNYWSQIPPSFNVNCGLQQVSVNYTPYYTECPASIGDIVGSQIEDIGGGLYDTVYISAGGGEGGSYSTKTTVTGNAHYFQAITKRKQGDFAGAIDKCKELINGYDTSRYFLSSLSELYRNYLESDTIRNQNITNGLFNNLKTYLEQRIGQYSGNTQFVEKAYKYVLMCTVKTRNFSEAIAGYENIMNNHPDPVTRLNASWDRSAVIMLMGQGGGEAKLTITNDKLRIKKLLDKNPVHKTARNVFKDVASEFRSDFDTESDRSKYTKEELTELKRRIEKFNPSSLTEFKDKLASDIKLINVINATKRTDIDKEVNTPMRFTLYQNYPNPFNPVTLIKYDIPKDAFVTIRVYDILGKEVFKAEEFKKSGSYELKFDGTNFASGMYFYSLETNGFKDTKKMVLLK